METQKRTLNEVNNVYDIINFIKGNTSNIEDVIEEIKKVCGNKLSVKYRKKSKSYINYTLVYTDNSGISHEILCGSHYSPYPNIECYVL